MFQLIFSPTSPIAQAISVLLAAAIILATVRQPRRMVIALASVAVALLAVYMLGIALVLALGPGNRAVAAMAQYVLVPADLSAAPALAAWVVALARAARAGHWGWLAGLLPFVLFAMVWPFFPAYMDLIVGHAAANSLDQAISQSAGAIFFIIAAGQLLTPLVTLVYGLVARDDAPRSQAQMA
jgi:hypothetical protein